MRPSGGHRRGRSFRLQVQPIVPFTLGKRVMLVMRTIVPLIHQAAIPSAEHQESAAPPETPAAQTGIGDMIVSGFFAARRGPNLGLGPVVLLPTATRPLLGTRKLGLGPSAAALDVRGPFTYGVEVDHHAQ